ncbi:MAG TPA: GspH/FimT family protein [Kiloniellaceae bacterium]|nr:GspH/FimT family protein [Kiloniellaceae bacterium]
MSARGFTLIELLVVLALLGLFITLVPTTMQHALPGMNLKVAVRELVDGFRAARSSAVSGNREAFILIDVDRQLYRIDREGENHVLPGRLSVDLRTAASEQLDESRGRIRFYPDGTSTGGRVTLSSGDDAYNINVDWFNGRVEVVRTDAIQ